MPDELLAFDSFDHYATADFFDKWTSHAGNAPSITSARTNNGLLFTATSAPSWTMENEYDTFCLGVARWSQGFANSVAVFFNTRQGITASLEGIGDGRLQVRLQGGGPTMLVPGFVMHQERWYHFGFRAFVDRPSAGNVRITFSVWVNGRQLLTDQTLTTTLSGSDTLYWAAFTLGSPGGGANTVVDDLWVTNELFLGDILIGVMRPEADGDSTDWVANTGDNWAAKDDATPDGDTTYIESSTVGDKELQELEDITALGPIVGIQALWLAQKDEAGVATYDAILKINGTEYVQGEEYPSFGSWLYGRYPLLISPDTSTDWTETELNAMQQGEERAS